MTGKKILQYKYAKNRNCKEWRKEDAWRLRKYIAWIKNK